MRKQKRPSSGCVYVFFVGLLAIVLFVINTLIVQSIIVTIPMFEDQKFKQFVQIAFPVMMIFAEYWIYDFLTDLLDRRLV
jgi:hypothetical protein